MADFEISIKSNVAEFQKQLDAVARTQIPYATSLAINSLARTIMKAEEDEIEKTFPSATPFTKRGLAYIPAVKNKLFATVFIKDIQEKYLSPYADGGQSVPTPGGAMVVPVSIGVNKYGNIPKGKVSNMKGRSGVFYATKGKVKFANGKTFSGVFQRLNAKGGGPRIKILVKMQDPWMVKQHFGFEARARATVDENFQDAMEQAMLRALGSMR